MGQVLHGSARTTEAVRRAIQLRQESVRAAAKRYGVSPTTIQKWRSRQTTGDSRMGPKEPRSSVLSSEDEAIVVAELRVLLGPCEDGSTADVAARYGIAPSTVKTHLKGLFAKTGMRRQKDLMRLLADTPQIAL